MNENNNNSMMLEEDKSSFDFKQFFRLLLFNWYWIIISMIVCIIIAFGYLWFTPTSKTVSNKMQLLGDSKQSSAASAKAAVLNSLPMGLGSSLGGGSLGIEAEKEILKSTPLIREVVYELGLHTEYRIKSWGRGILKYKNQPIVVSLDTAHLQWFDKELLTTYHEIKLNIHKHSNVYSVVIILKKGKKELELPVKEITKLPESIKTEYGILTITDNIFLTAEEKRDYSDDFCLEVTIIPPQTCANKMSRRLSLEAPTKKVTNMLTISFLDENHIRGIDFINTLVEHYNKRANDEKNEEVMRNEEFVNNRMAKLDKEMGSSDAAWESSKKNFHITSPEIDAEEVMKNKGVYENQLVAIGTELQLHDYLSEYVNDPSNLYEIIPSAASSVVIKNSDSSGGASGTASFLTQHNSLVNQRRDLLKSVSEMSPQIQRINQSIQELHPVIQTALKRDRQQILMRQNTIQREYGKYVNRVSTAPQMERVLTEIGRERSIKQSVYLLMLQKREETAMELSKTAMKGKLIDITQISAPEKPQRKMVLLIALFFGALVPMGFLFLLQMLKNKINYSSDIQSISHYPIVGEIPLQDNGEAIRNLRTNLLLNLREGQKTILIASDSVGDGKSFIARQLADSLNAIGKKALLIDGDLRKSNRGGHPADILASESFAKEVAMAQTDYDYVIFDSPAMSQYADAYQLATFADVTLFVIKSGVTNKIVIESLSGDTKLPNIMLALNAIDTTSKKYKLNKK